MKIPLFFSRAGNYVDRDDELLKSFDDMLFTNKIIPEGYEENFEIKTQIQILENLIVASKALKKRASISQEQKKLYLLTF